jgi:uncharacterized phage protein (TIGR01671 family)
MREIKFRVWHYNEMVYFEPQDSWQALKYHFDECDDRPEWLMQYTGLKDKNGKEIYEGDILNNGYTVNYDILYNCGCCNDDTGIGFVLSDSHTAFDDLEVVGNIWGNPELLK